MLQVCPAFIKLTHCWGNQTIRQVIAIEVMPTEGAKDSIEG